MTHTLLCFISTNLVQMSIGLMKKLSPQFTYATEDRHNEPYEVWEKKHRKILMKRYTKIWLKNHLYELMAKR